MRKILVAALAGWALVLVSCTVPPGAGSSSAPTAADQQVLAKLELAVAHRSDEECRRVFADSDRARAVAERVCAAWLAMARVGELTIRPPLTLIGAADGRIAAELEYRLGGERGVVVESFQVEVDVQGQVTDVLAPATLWGTQEFHLTLVDLDVLVDADPAWVTAWRRARTAIDAVSWPKPLEPVVVEFPKAVSVFLFRAQTAAPVDVGAVLARVGPTGWRIVVNPVTPITDQARAAQLLAHELVHLAMRELDSEQTPLWLAEGFAEYSSWTVRPAARAEAQALVAAAGPPGASRPTAADFDDPETLMLAYARSALAVGELIDRDGRAAFLQKYAQGAYH